MSAIIIKGKQYKSIASYPSKKTALKVADENRKGGKWNSRVVKEGNKYTVYNRKKN